MWVASNPNFRYSARMPRLLACTLPVRCTKPAWSDACSTACMSSSATWPRPGTSAVASERKLPYRAPVRELVRADSQAQPTGTAGLRGGHRHQGDLARLAQRPRHPLAVQRRVLDGLVAERGPGDVDLEPGDHIQVVLGGRGSEARMARAGAGARHRPAAGRAPAWPSAIGRSTVPPQSGQPAAFSRAIVLQRAPGPT